MTGPAATSTIRSSFDETRLEQLWEQVPPEFRVWRYDLNQPPFDRALRGARAQPVDLPVEDLTVSLRQELAWWVWCGPVRSNRRVEVEALQRLVEAIHELVDGAALVSLIEPEPVALLKGYRTAFHRRLGRLPGPAVVKSFTTEVRLLQEALTRAYSPLAWWQQDLWSPRVDSRIPVRTHEPLGSQSVSFLRIRQPWLRQALKHYARFALESGALTWGSLLQRFCHVGVYFGDFTLERGLAGPALVEQPETQLRPVMLDFQSWLRNRPRARGRGTAKGETGRLSMLTLRQTQVSIRGFYDYAVDHRAELAEATGDTGFLALSGAHLRLWRPCDVPGPRGRQLTNPAGYLEDADLARMIEHVAVLGMPPDQTVVVPTATGPRTVAGLGDPSAMRVWLIQALTGRRANEVLMLDFNPLLPVPGLGRRTGEAGSGDELVAKLRYQQTKIEGAPNTILVGDDVVALVHEQQRWARQRLRLAPEDADPPYLFPSLNHNPRGTRHRPLGGYHSALQRLTEQLNLVDRQGRTLEFSKSHRLRHTKATTLINLGVPLHVVMRYMGHLSPEMTLHYGQTLAETAEREFLRARKLGHDGRELEVSPRDVYDLIALSSRTDRVLPTGVCLLPPAKRCDKGNACYSCTHFATDATFLDAHREQLAATQQLIEQRAAQHLARTGRPMTPDNIWLAEQHATVAALQRLITRLEDPIIAGNAVKGAGTTTRGPVPVEVTLRPTGAEHG